jgi:hypothetical protein
MSNYYIGEAGAAGPSEGKMNKALDARAFEWNEKDEEWVQLGENLHANEMGARSRYFITLSDDGMLLGMGDPGKRDSEGGSVTGHAHIPTRMETHLGTASDLQYL